MFTELDEYINEGYVKKALDWSVNYCAQLNVDADLKNEIEMTLLQNISRLAFIDREKRHGIIDMDSYRIEFNMINLNVIRMTSMFKSADFEDLGLVKVEESKDRKKRVVEADFLDRIFKGALVVLFIISILILARSLIIAQANTPERWIQIAVSMIAGFAAYFGYYRWKLTEQL